MNQLGEEVEGTDLSVGLLGTLMVAPPSILILAAKYSLSMHRRSVSSRQFQRVQSLWSAPKHPCLAATQFPVLSVAATMEAGKRQAPNTYHRSSERTMDSVGLLSLSLIHI